MHGISICLKRGIPKERDNLIAISIGKFEVDHCLNRSILGAWSLPQFSCSEDDNDFTIEA